MIEKAYYVIKTSIPHSIDLYWNKHTVTPPFNNKIQSIDNFKHICKEYINYCQHAGLNNNMFPKYNQKRILVYGCGTGTEIAPIIEYSTPLEVVGVDISKTALSICRNRVSYHRNNDVVKLQHIDSKHLNIGEQNYYDYAFCLGVLHHIPISNIYSVLKEINRVMKPGSSMRIMVYNEDSIYYHLSIGYVYQIVKNIFRNDATYTAFRKISEHGNSPCSYVMNQDMVKSIASHTGFDAHFIGNSISKTEINDYNNYYKKAIEDPRFSDEHKTFLMNLNGYKYNGKYAGIDQLWDFIKRAD